MSVVLQLLGPVQITQGGQVIENFRTRRAVALLAYLVHHRQPVFRSELVELIWPDKSEKRGRANLRWALNYLNKILPQVWDVTRQSVQFAPTNTLTVDIHALAHALDEMNYQVLERMLLAQRGEFLAGFYLNQSAEFETWLVSVRSYWQQQVEIAHWQLIDHYRQAGQTDKALAVTYQLLNLDVWREDVHRLLMELMMRCGQIERALAQYEQCRHILREQFETEPAPATQALYQRFATFGREKWHPFTRIPHKVYWT